MSMKQEMKEFAMQHHWKVLNLVCCLALTWQMSGIFSEYLHPTQETIRITEKKLGEDQFPLLIKICPDPGFNYTAVTEEGYKAVSTYFYGKSKYTDTGMYGWAGHTNTSENRGTVEDIYQRVVLFPQPQALISR